MLKRVPVIALALAAVLFSTTTWGLAAGSRSFHWVLKGQTAVKPCGAGVLCLTATDSGQTKLLGFTRAVTHARVQLSRVPCAAGQGVGAATTFTQTTTFTASNGDTLTTVGAGVACHSAGGTISVSGLMITGGTGGFARAHGSGRERIVESARGAETVRLTGSLAMP